MIYRQVAVLIHTLYVIVALIGKHGYRACPCQRLE